MKYLKKFETQSAYEAAQSGLILPNVSLTVDNNTVHYNPSAPAPTGHPYVEIAGVKWAKYNVGATSETEYGDYYQYGKGADTYQVTSGQSDYSGNENPLAASADTATQVWGGQWHMPTQAELNSLTANTNFTFETDFNGSGVNGGKFTDKTDSSKYIFIPAAGYYVSGSLTQVGELGDIWSSSIDGSNRAYYLVSHYNGFTNVSTAMYREFGFPIRPVLG